jgi:transposase-like protein
MANNSATKRRRWQYPMLCEGSSIRSIKRIAGVRRDTIMRHGVLMGEGCQHMPGETSRFACIVQVHEHENLLHVARPGRR